MSTEKQVQPVTWFENKHWLVNQNGINSKDTDVVVTWEEDEQFYKCSVKTIWPFYLEPWPFRASTRKEAWFDLESYSEAFRFAVGGIAMKTWNRKAAQQYNLTYPNAE